MKKFVDRFIPVVLFFLSALLLSACSRQSESLEKTSELVIGVSQDYRATDVFSHKGFNCLVFQTLVKTDPSTGDISPLLAESWEVSDDGKHYLFHLRKEAVFSDGTPVTAGQVRESMLYKQTRGRKRSRSGWSGGSGRGGTDDGEALNREYGTFDNQRYSLPNWYAFESIDVIDEHILRFNLRQPYTLFLQELATTHMYPVLKADDTEEVTGYIGTGPYRIDEQKRTQYMTLVRNEHFWQGEVKIENIRLKVIPDAETRAIALEAGEIHLTGYDHFDKIPNESVIRLRELSELTVKRLASVDHPSISYLAINYQKEHLADENVRKAVAFAIDTAPIETIMSETGRVVIGPFPEDHVLFNRNITPYGYDPEWARRLLARAGWTDSDRDGILDKEGERLSLSLSFNSFDPQYKTVAEIVQAQLGAVGIELKLEMLELGAHITNMRSAAYDLAIWPMMRYHMFFYTGHPSWLNVYNSSELDDAFSRYLHSEDAGESRNAVRQTQQVILDSYVFPLFFERFDVVAWNHEVLKDFDPQPLGWDLAMELWNARVE